MLAAVKVRDTAPLHRCRDSPRLVDAVQLQIKNRGNKTAGAPRSRRAVASVRPAAAPGESARDSRRSRDRPPAGLAAAGAAPSKPVPDECTQPSSACFISSTRAGPEAAAAGSAAALPSAGLAAQALRRLLRLPGLTTSGSSASSDDTWIASNCVPLGSSTLAAGCEGPAAPLSSTSAAAAAAAAMGAPAAVQSRRCALRGCAFGVCFLFRCFTGGDSGSLPPSEKTAPRCGLQKDNQKACTSQNCEYNASHTSHCAANVPAAVQQMLMEHATCCGFRGPLAAHHLTQNSIVIGISRTQEG